MMYRRARGLPASDTGTSTSLAPNDPGGPGAAEGLDEVAALATGLAEGSMTAVTTSGRCVRRRIGAPRWMSKRCICEPTCSIV